jgi:hypothetical protein
VLEKPAGGKWAMECSGAREGRKAREGRNSETRTEKFVIRPLNHHEKVSNRRSHITFARKIVEDSDRPDCVPNGTGERNRAGKDGAG